MKKVIILTLSCLFLISIPAKAQTKAETEAWLKEKLKVLVITSEKGGSVEISDCKIIFTRYSSSGSTKCYVPFSAQLVSGYDKNSYHFKGDITMEYYENFKGTISHGREQLSFTLNNVTDEMLGRIKKALDHYQKNYCEEVF